MDLIGPDPVSVERLSEKLAAYPTAKTAGGRRLFAVGAGLAVTAAVVGVCIAGAPLLRLASGGTVRPTQSAAAAATVSESASENCPAAYSASSSTENPYAAFFAHVAADESSQKSTNGPGSFFGGGNRRQEVPIKISGGGANEPVSEAPPQIHHTFTQKAGAWTYTLDQLNDGPVSITIAAGQKNAALQCTEPLKAYETVSASFTPSALYIRDGRLIAVLSGGNISVELFYDVSDPQNPRFLKSFGQSGGYRQSSFQNGELNTVTAYSPGDAADENNPSTYIPQTYQDGKASLLPADGIYDNGSGSFNVLTAIRPAGVPTMTQAKAVLGGSPVYFSADSFILYSFSTVTVKDSVKYGRWITVPENKRTSTTGSRVRYCWHDTVTGRQVELTLYSLDSGTITEKGSITLPGCFHSDTTMIDEHSGVFRVFTDDGDDVMSNGCYQNEKGESIEYAGAGIPAGDSLEAMRPDTQNRLFILDANFNLLGKTPNLTTEWVNSITFDDAKNICTLKTQDDTVVVNLSDNKNPKIE